MRSLLLVVVFGLIGASGFVLAQDQATPTLPPEYRDHITVVAWSPDGEFIATGDWNGHINITDASGQLIRTLNGHTGLISTLAWNSKGTQLASGSQGFDLSVRIWDIATGEIIHEFTNLEDIITVVTWSRNDEQIIFSPLSGDSPVLDIASGRLLSRLDIGTVYHVSWSHDGTKIALPEVSGGIEIFDPDSYQKITDIGANTGKISGPIANQITSITWNTDGTAIAVGTWGGQVLIWDVKSGQLTFEQRGNDYIGNGNDSYLTFIVGVRFNSNGTKLTSVGRDGTVRSWDTTTGQELENAKIPSLIFAVDWSPDGSKIAYGGEGTTFQIVTLSDLFTPPTETPP